MDEPSSFMNDEVHVPKDEVFSFSEKSKHDEIFEGLSGIEIFFNNTLTEVHAEI